MNILIQFISLIFSIFIINIILKKLNWLCSNTGELHQKLANKNNIPLSGGFFILIGFIFGIDQYSKEFSFFITFIFCIGILSDTNIIKSPIKRFFLQIIVSLVFIFISNLTIGNTRIILLDYLLSNKIFNYIFVLFCITIMINGNNFIDGLNTLVIGYYTAILSFLYFISSQKLILIPDVNFTFLLIIFGTVYLFNFFNKLFIGDNGAYVVGFTFSIILIKFFISNQHVSPFFIILLLWYPCFETLFSILRKLLTGRSPFKPDRNHLHQLIFLNIKKLFSNNEYLANIITANLIVIYNILIFTISIKDITNSQFQLLLITANILIYLLTYFRLFYLKLKGV